MLDVGCSGALGLGLGLGLGAPTWLMYSFPANSLLPLTTSRTNSGKVSWKGAVFSDELWNLFHTLGSGILLLNLNLSKVISRLSRCIHLAMYLSCPCRYSSQTAARSETPFPPAHKILPVVLGMSNRRNIANPAPIYPFLLHTISAKRCVELIKR